jgi:predicted acyltransferase
MKLTKDRILSIDAFRGITILTMIFVNEVAGVRGLPPWMKHMPANADAMSFVDVVFPAFLFIVGMSIPFALNNRLQKGDSIWQLQLHIVLRTLGLLVLGVFMVNAEDGVYEALMPISLPLWSLLFYVFVIMIWNVYPTTSRSLAYLLRGLGIAGLVLLAVVYRGGDHGQYYLSPHWWGILGLIGWAYFVGCMLYQLSRGSIAVILLMIAGCIGYYAVGHSAYADTHETIKVLFSQGGHASHTSIVLCGIVLSLLFFGQPGGVSIPRRFAAVFAYAMIMLLAGFWLRPMFQISKIYATPTWCLYSAASCTLLFALIYWVTDLRKLDRWTAFFRPAASNPLLTYIIPFIVYALMQLLNIHLSELLTYGWPGIMWAIVFSVAVMGLVIVLNRMKVKLQL